MNWFWEATHFKKELGDLVLDRIWEHQKPGRIVDPGFGILISSRNIETHLKQIRSDRQVWRKLFPKDVQEIEKMSQQ